MSSRCLGDTWHTRYVSCFSSSTQRLTDLFTAEPPSSQLQHRDSRCMNTTKLIIIRLEHITILYISLHRCSCRLELPTPKSRCMFPTKVISKSELSSSHSQLQHRYSRYTFLCAGAPIVSCSRRPNQDLRPGPLPQLRRGGSHAHCLRNTPVPGARAGTIPPR